MSTIRPVSRLIDLLDPSRNFLQGLSNAQAQAIVARGIPEEIQAIDGQFALVARDGITVRMARTIGRLMRYFIAKRDDGPALVVADRIDSIHSWLQSEGLDGQFHPSYTRMVPAHHLVELKLVGCPDPNPTYRRFFDPVRGTLAADLDLIGERYIRRVYDEIAARLKAMPPTEPVGVCFSGGIDSGSVLVLTYQALRELGMNPSRLKAFTLSVDGGGRDLEQARAFVRALDLEVFLDVVEAPGDWIDPARAVAVMEDYKPLDVQAGTMSLALLRGIRQRYSQWRYLFDGEGGDENLKDYPIEENPELTIKSVLNNSMLYQEGWGVESIKHSLTYSGGQSRGYARSYAPASAYGFDVLSPYVSRSVIEVAEAIPFIELTDWRHDELYKLKGEIVSRGVRAVAGIDMPVYEKRRFQHGVMEDESYARTFNKEAGSYRRTFHALYG